VIVAGALLFSLGGLTAFLIPSRAIRLRLFRRRTIVGSLWIKRVFLLFLVVNAFALLGYTIGLASLGSGSTFMVRVRDSYLEAAMGNQQSGLGAMSYLGLLVPDIALFTTVLFQIEKRDRYFWTAATLALLTSILTTGRTTILVLFSSIAAIQLMKDRKVTISQSAPILKWPVIFFIGLFVLLIFTNKGSVEQTGNAMEVGISSTAAYLTCPTAALDHVVLHPGEFAERSNYTFRFFLKVAAALHLISYTPPPAIDDYVFVPFATNVYTVYKPYITDFGLYGALSVFLIIGFLHSVLYRKAKVGSNFWMYLFSMTIFPAIMVSFNDVYTWMFGILIQASLFYVIYMALRVLKLVPSSFVLLRTAERAIV